MAKIARSSRRRVLILHGPKLNLLGTREPRVYGREKLSAINSRLMASGRTARAEVLCYQSNVEGELIERIQQAARDGVRFIVFNPAAYTHTSVALRDALGAVAIPYIEVHLSNVHARKPFRHRSYFSDLAVGTICGLGSRGYDFALDFALKTALKAEAGR